MAEAIKVAVRVRPLNQREKDTKCAIIVSMSEKTTTVLGRNPKHFTYDWSYWSVDVETPHCHTQADVFLDIGKAILTNALNGFNGTLFAYGQTGSGKSYTVMGPHSDPGLIPRTVANLFGWKMECENKNPPRDMEVYISYLEIYKEHVTDLLCPEPRNQEQLKIMDHPKLGVYVRGLSEVPCARVEDVMKNLQYGIKKRVVAATNMNATSSRSHSVFCIRLNTLEGPRPKPGEKDDRKTLSAKVNLIDLAGSERASKAGTENERLKEGSSINQSLSALGMCIKTLSEISQAAEGGDGKDKVTPVVPFRMSKLTFLLKDSLAGNSKTYMIATISPAAENYEETLSTLRFASSVKKIQTIAVQNKDKKDEVIEKMEEEIRALKAQIQSGAADISEASELMKERERLKEELKKDFQEDLRLAKEMQIVRDQALEETGLSQSHIIQAFGISKGTPYLLNMADDPLLAGCLIYLIKDSEHTLIGAHKDNTITLKGVGIPDFLCKVENSGNMRVSIERVSEGGRVVVNGKLLYPNQPHSLHNGDHIYLGRACALKLIMPADPGASPAATVGNLSLEGLEEEYAALDDSPSWGSLTPYLDQVLRQMPADGATQLLKHMKKACQFCDEANELTSECHPDNSIHFEVDLPYSMPPCVVIRVMYCAAGRDCEEEDAWETKYLWTVAQLIERVDRMRDYCGSFKRLGYLDIDPIDDPWNEMEQVEMAQRIRCAENLAEDARLHMLQEHAIAKRLRTLFLVRPNQNPDGAILRFFIRAWKVQVFQSKSDAQEALGGPRKSRLKGASRSRRSGSDYSDTSSHFGHQLSLESNPNVGLIVGSAFEEMLHKTDSSKRTALSRPKSRSYKRQVAINSDQSELSPVEPVACEVPETTPEATVPEASRVIDSEDPHVRLDKAVAEANELRSLLFDSHQECESLKEQVKLLRARQQECEELINSHSSHQEEVSKHTEVAWQLCDLLRDYARHLLDSQSACAVTPQVQTMLVRQGSVRIDHHSRSPSPAYGAHPPPMAGSVRIDHRSRSPSPAYGSHPPPMAAANLPVHNQPISVAGQRLEVSNPARAFPPPMAAVPASPLPPHSILPQAFPVSVPLPPQLISSRSVPAPSQHLQPDAPPVFSSALLQLISGRSLPKPVQQVISETSNPTQTGACPAARSAAFTVPSDSFPSPRHVRNENSVTSGITGSTRAPASRPSARGRSVEPPCADAGQNVCAIARTTEPAVLQFATHSAPGSSKLEPLRVCSNGPGRLTALEEQVRCSQIGRAL